MSTPCVSQWSILCPISLLELMFKPLLDSWLVWVRASPVISFLWEPGLVSEMLPVLHRVAL